MTRMHVVCDSELYLRHKEATRLGESTEDLPPHTVEVAMTEEEEAQAEQDAAQARTERANRDAARTQRDADVALLTASDDPHHQALARLLAGG